MSERIQNSTSSPCAALEIASLSDIGMRRTTNQDNFAVSLAANDEQYHRRGHLFIVADGMGAHAAGELASKIAVDQIPHLYSKYDDLSAPEALKKAVIGANTEIHRRGQANDDFHNMGTTCSVLMLVPQGAIVAHIGDSRVYRLRKNLLEQLTFDHSLVWEMHQSGQLTREEMESGKIPKNVITRSLGPYPECKVDVEGPFPLQVGDTFLLCSDGLTGPVTDQEIGALLAHLPPKKAARVLVDLANLRGGPDNITCVIAKVVDPNMATRADTQPIRLGRTDNSGGQISPISWGIVIASGLAIVLFYLITRSWITTSIPAIVFIGGLIWMLKQVISQPGYSTVDPGRRFGKGPYVQVKGGSEQVVADQLKEIATQLREAGREQGWDIDWTQFYDRLGSAEDKVTQQKFDQAIQEFGEAITTLMDQLRNQNGSSSAIDLST